MWRCELCDRTPGDTYFPKEWIPPMTRLRNWFRLLPARLAVVAKAAPTYLVVASTFVTIAADEIAKALPEQAETIGAAALRITVVLGAIVGIIRRSTPVFKAERGILPPGP